jgi:hypothetical protein
MTPNTRISMGGIVDPQGNPFKGVDMPKYTWQELLNDRSNLGKMAASTSDYNKKRIFKDLITAIDDDIAKFAETTSTPEAKTYLDTANKFYSSGDGASLPGIGVFRDPKVNKAIYGKNPEDTVRQFITTNNVSDITRLSKAVGPDGMNAVKQSWLTDLLESGSPAKFATSFDKFKPETLEAFLSKEEIEGLMNLSKISKTISNAEKSVSNPSGTGQNVKDAGIIIKFIRSLGSPVEMAKSTASAFGGRQAAKQYFENPAVREALITGKILPSTEKSLSNYGKTATMAVNPYFNIGKLLQPQQTTTK